MPKKFVVVHPEEQPRKYKSVISHVEIDLPDDPMGYTSVPNAVDGEGIWAASGVNEANVGMTATETITSNPRVLGADPLVTYQLQRTVRRKQPVESERKILYPLFFHTSIAPAKGNPPWKHSGEIRNL